MVRLSKVITVVVGSSLASGLYTTNCLAGDSAVAASPKVATVTLNDVFTTSKLGTKFSGTAPQGIIATGGSSWGYDKAAATAGFATTGTGTKASSLTVTIPTTSKTGVALAFSSATAAGGDIQLQSAGCAKSPVNCSKLMLDGHASGLKSSEFGIWSNVSSTGAVSTVAIATGVPTATMPKTGTATYTGTMQGSVSSTLNPSVANGLTGAVALTADFAKATISGSITNISPFSTPVNNILLANAPIKSGGVNGTLTLGPAPSGTGAVDLTGATGTYAAKFYGPSATEIAGTFHLAGGTNHVQLIGSFGAHK